MARLTIGELSRLTGVKATTIRWYEALDRRERGDAAEFARLFLVPGLGHCSGGPATGSFSPFAALVDWVERGIAPQRAALLCHPLWSCQGAQEKPPCPGIGWAAVTVLCIR